MTKFKNSYHTLRLILGDQLNAQHSWYKRVDENVLFVIAELKQEGTYVKHHIQKLCGFFAAMENFAIALEKKGHHILHLNLEETTKHKDFPSLLRDLCERYSIKQFEYQQPDEFRLDQQLNKMRLPSGVEISCVSSEHFFLPHEELKTHFKKDKAQKMEFFYRKMRNRFGILMNGDKPEGEKWNFDAENRNKFKADDIKEIPEPLLFANDISKILRRIEKHQIPHFGKALSTLLWPTSRRQALSLLDFFCTSCLPYFGTFQDAMTTNSPHRWSLYHSRLSFALNTKMLSPKQVIDRAVDTYRKNSSITLAQIEGFVRQIIGWREFIRGMYWVNMPDYAGMNKLNAQRTLPDYFWSGNTKMRCLQEAIGQSLDYAYAHHIQRLMITGNFCLLTGIDPRQVDDWYLGIYMDAIEWVEMPNTRGMSQFADGGLVATKPYAAGGNYVNKMSDYCKSCHYSVSAKVGEKSCPLNSLYWNFIVKHRERLANNPRIGMIYRTWDKNDDEKKQSQLARAKWCLDHIEEL